MDEICEDPFAAVVTKDLVKQICSACFKRVDDLQRCSNCKFIHYCSAKCQKSDWPIHKIECRSLVTVQPNVPPEFVRLMARIVWKLSTNSEQTYRNFDDLMSHEIEVKNDLLRQENIVTSCAILKQYLGEEHKIANPSKMIEMFGKIVTNSFTILDSDLNSLGSGLYLRLSVLDHSCDPNACIIFDGSKAVLRPLESEIFLDDLSKIRISYIEMMSTKIERQRQLKEQYYFECKCTRCSDDNDGKDCKMVGCNCPDQNECCCDVQRDIQAVQWKIIEIEKIKKTGDFIELRNEIREALSKCSSLGPMNVHRIRLLEYIFDACIELTVWEAALDYGYMILPAYRFYYPTNHPTLVLHLMKLTKLLLVTEKLGAAMPILEEAERMCAQCFGKKHPLYEQINDNLVKLRAELGIQSDRNAITN